MGKYFTAIINNRLLKYADSVKLSTIDLIFSLYTVIELFGMFKEKLCCAFIDFEEAFDSVWQAWLWNKVIMSNIDGKCCKIITNMFRELSQR